MANDLNPTVRAELIAARDALAPQIRGLDDLEDVVDASHDLHQHIVNKLAALIRRRDLISDVINHLDGTVTSLEHLEADGYPDELKDSLDPGLYQELAGEISDMEAAFALFLQEAARLSVTLGSPTDKP